MTQISFEKIETSRLKRQIQIAGVGTAVPSVVHTQGEILASLLSNLDLKKQTQALYKRVLSHPSIQTRHFALDSLKDAFQPNLDIVQERFEKEGTKLATRALNEALTSAQIRPLDLDMLIAVTCTGYLCPGFAARLVETNGLNPRISTADLVGMGCGGALPGLQQAFHFLQSNPGATAAVVCVEICSAAFFSNDDPDIVVSNSLFSDGAAAVVLNHRPALSDESDGDFNGAPTFQQFESLVVPAWRDELRFQSSGGRLKNVLGPLVPQHAAAALKKIIAALLQSHGLRQDDIRHWILHPGGEKVLQEIQTELHLEKNNLEASRAVLKHHGNMSSASVLFVLRECIDQKKAKPGDWGIVSSFGAGFSAFGALVKF